MNSKLSIINSALSRMGERPLSSIDQETTTAISMRNVYDQARAYVLRMHPWSCARKRQQVSPITTRPTFGYQNAFPIPADCIRILATGTNEWEVEGRYILANTDLLELVYIWNSDKEQEWDSALAEALTLHLTSEMCKTITGSSASGEVASVKLREVIQQAKTINGMERPSQNISNGYSSELIWSRY